MALRSFVREEISVGGCQGDFTFMKEFFYKEGSPSLFDSALEHLANENVVISCDCEYLGSTNIDFALDKQF